MPRRSNIDSKWAAPLVRALPPGFKAEGRTRGAAQTFGGILTTRHSLASHQAAEPERWSQVS